jgi:hypothetical protein
MGKHPSVFCIRGETSFFDELPVTRQRFPNLKNEAILRDFVSLLIDFSRIEYPKVNPSEYGGEPEKTNSNFIISDTHIESILAKARQAKDYSKIFLIVYDNLTYFSGKKRWMEKTPTHIFHIDEISDLIPDAQFVELVRDPRDILVSKKARKSADWVSRHRVEVRDHIRLSRGYDPVMDTLGWKSAIHAGDEAHQKYPNRIIRVRYEDLVGNPEMEIKRICEFLDLGFNYEMLNVGWINATTGSDFEMKDGIYTNSVRKWQRELDSEGVAICQFLAKSEMVRLGYSCSPTKLGTYIKISVRWRLGGFYYSRNMMKNYLGRFLNLTK